MAAISIIVPVYKVEPYLRRCVDSILVQTFADFELILVDDGSPDNCPAICDEYAAKDSRVRVIHQENSGVSAARNAGLDALSPDSEWITFVDSDDWVNEEYLERLYDAVREHHTEVSVCGYVQTKGEEPDLAETDMTPQLWTPEDFFVEHQVNATVPWGKLYQKKCFENIRYPVGKIHEDEFVTHRILFEDARLSVIIAPLYCYYCNTGGIMRRPWKPERLVGLEALEQKMNYMLEHGYKRACEKTACLLAWRLTADYRELVEHYPEKKAQLRMIKKRLRGLLRQFPEFFELEKNYYLYEQAYPLGMKLYWYWQAVKRRLKKCRKSV